MTIIEGFSLFSAMLVVLVTLYIITTTSTPGRWG